MTGATLRDLRNSAVARLTAAGVASPESDADWILVQVTGLDRGALFTRRSLTDPERNEFAALVSRRVAREPLQHILGEAWFRHLTLAVGPGVFVPRPETEILVDLAISALLSGEGSAESSAHARCVVDLCTGSAAIPLAICLEVGGVRGYAIELESAAAAWAQRNIDAHADQLQAARSTLELTVGDATAADVLLQGLAGKVDLLTCNPPYIPDNAIPRDPEVRDYDPAAALFGGPDGLEVVRGVVLAAAVLLKPGGRLLVEHGDAQGDADGILGVPALLAASPLFAEVTDHRDLAGKPRVTAATRV